MPVGNWRAALELPGGPAAFGLEIGREGNGYRATLINGQERVQVPMVRFERANLTLEFPAYNNTISAQYVDERLVGTLTLVKRDLNQTIPFTAEHASTQASAAATGSNTDISGRWAVTFTESDNSRYPAIGEFAQRGSRLYGTFLTPTGDFRYLGGEIRGTRFTLSNFDGAHAFLFSGQVLPNGSLRGEFWSGLSSHETWVGLRDAKATLPDPDTLTYLKPGYDRFSFRFPDTGGNMVSLDDERFRDKVVIVTLAGSWCPNCHDEAALLAAFYEKYKSRGLEIVALMFEHTDDFEAAARQVERFREKFSANYTMLVAGSSDKDEAGKALPSLNRVLAFPTTLFIARSGKLARIYTGFKGPGTGDHFARQREDFVRQIEVLLAN